MNAKSVPSVPPVHSNTVVSFAVRQKQFSGYDWSLEVISVSPRGSESDLQGTSPNYYWERQPKVLGAFASLRDGTKEGPAVLTVTQAPFSPEVTITRSTDQSIKMKLSNWRWFVSDLPWPRIGGQFEHAGHKYSWNFKALC